MRKVLIFIPARMGSKRFPGKCMHKIGKFPLVCWTYVQARMTGYATIVATPDTEISHSLFNDRQIPCILTSDRPRNGSERCAEAMANEIFDTMGDTDLIINVQGDMVKFENSCISTMVQLLSNGRVEYATVFSKLHDGAAPNPNRVKCSIRFDSDLGVLLVDDFSRYPIPDRENYLHVGIYGFTKRALEQYCQLPVSDREKEMRLEQMRIVDNGFKIGGIVSNPPIVVDCPADVCIAEEEMKNFECFFPL